MLKNIHKPPFTGCLERHPRPSRFVLVTKKGSKYGKIRIWALGGSGGHFHYNSESKTGPKLCKIILLHVGLVTFRFHFRFHFRKTRKVIISMISGPSGRNHGRQNQVFLTLGPPNNSNQFKEVPESF